MSDKLVKLEVPELQSIEKSKAESIRATFEPMVEMLEGFEVAYNGVIQEAEKEITQDVTAKARRLRIDIGRVRIDTEKLRKEQKEEYLRAGKAIDGVSNILKWAVTDKENRLKEIENHYEIMEQKRLEELQRERAEQLAPYVEDADERNLSSMEEDVWNAYFGAKKKEHEDRIEAERKAEENRIAQEKADAEERKRIEAENARLKKEAEKREKEREAYEAKLKAEREKAAAAQRELEAKQEAERKAREAEEARIQSELNKGDAEKVADLISDLQTIKTKYVFKSKSNQKMHKDVCMLIDKIVAHIQGDMR